MDSKTLIRNLGGPTKVAALLGLDKKAGAVQRISNWAVRGIPSKVLLEHSHVFLNASVKRSEPA